MLRATLKGVLARKLRLLLASFAILLGVSFISGTYVLTDTIGRVFDDLFTTVNKGVAVVVTGESAVGSNDRSSFGGEPIPFAVLDKIKAVPGVRAARGNVGGLTTLVLPNGKAKGGFGPPTFGTAFDPADPLETNELKKGRAPHGIGEVVIDVTSADRDKLKIGDTIGVVGRKAEQKAVITGFIGFKRATSAAGATTLGFDTASASQLFGIPGTVIGIRVAADPGVSDNDLRTRIAAALPTKGYKVQTGAQAATSTAADIKEGLKFFTIALQAFGYIALFVGMFLIFNTFSMLVAQRTRELALLRALGASRRQVTRSVLIEAVLIGLLSSLAGFGLGILIAAALRGILDSVGIPLPQGPTVIELRTFVVCLVVGVGITVIAALVPARKAAKVAPVQAMRESTPAEERSLARRSVIGAVVIVLGLAALFGGLGAGQISLVGLGAVLSFLGLAVLSPLFARPVVRVLGAPFAAMGVPGLLGRGNAMRSPRRTSATAAALMIGLALVATVSTLGASAKKSTTDVVAQQFGADFVLHTKSFDFLSPEIEKVVTAAPGVRDVAAFRAGEANVGTDHGVTVQAVKGTALSKVLTLKVLSGSIGDLPLNTVAISKQSADTLGAKVGDTFPVTWTKGDGPDLTVTAIYDTNQFAGGYIVSDATWLPYNTDRGPFVVAVRQAAGSTPTATRASLDQALVTYPNIDIQDQKQFVAEQGQQIDTLLNIITALLVFSVLIALLGVVNTIALSVVERTRELGLLRAVGLQRRQLRRMIRVESVVIAVYGALLGAVVGIGFGYAIVRSLADEGITSFALPVGRLVFVLVLTALGGVLAAILPARRAAKMDVLEAVSAT